MSRQIKVPLMGNNRDLFRYVKTPEGWYDKKTGEVVSEKPVDVVAEEEKFRAGNRPGGERRFDRSRFMRELHKRRPGMLWHQGAAERREARESEKRRSLDAEVRLWQTMTGSTGLPPHLRQG
jgi:hypothetical protein